MIKIPMSAAGAGLVRAILARRRCVARAGSTGNLSSDRLALAHLTGERHELTLRIPGEDCAIVAGRLLDGLDEHEFTLSGQIVADLESSMTRTTDREPAIELRIEALTVEA